MCVVCIHLYCDKMVLTTLLLGICSAMSTNLSPQQVVKALEVLSNDETTKLVFFLGVSLNKLKDIEKGDTYKMYAIQAWLDKDTGASWEKIISGLKEIKKDVLAKEVAEQHCPQSPYIVTPSSDSSQPATTHPVTLPPVTEVVHSATQTNGSAVPPDTLTPTPTIQPASSTPPPPLTPSPATTCTAPTVTDHAQPSSTVTNHAQPSAVTNETQPFTITDHNQPSTLTHHAQPSTLTFWTVEKVKATILELQKRFADLTANAEDELCEQEKQDKQFLKSLRRYVLLSPVAKNATHVKFFQENASLISAAENTSKILDILCRYIDYRNYEILLQLITSYCAAPLQGSMQQYCQSLEGFEKATTVEVYTTAISAGKKLKVAFSQMALKIAKSEKNCTLYEIRKLKRRNRRRGISPFPQCVYCK